MTTTIRLSVVIPAYNEAKRLPETVRAVNAWLAVKQPDSEIIVVDDGSNDHTVALVRSLQKELPRLVLIVNERNRGKGAVVRQGLLAAKGQLRLFMDADHSTRIEEIAQVLARANEADVFVSSRYMRGSNVLVRQPWTRVLVSRVSNLVIRMLVSGIHDTQNGFKVYRAEVIAAIAPYLTIERWAFDVEMLYAARRAGFRILEFPVTWRNSADSRLNLVRDLSRTGREYLVLVRNVLRGRYPRSARIELPTLNYPAVPAPRVTVSSHDDALL